MIVTELYNGQGLGNQLFCYVATRVIATDQGFEFGIMSPEKCKGSDFLALDFGRKVVGGNGPEGGPPHVLPEGISDYYVEKRIIHPVTGADITMYDKGLVSVADGTKIDGIMQDEQYIAHRKDEIRQWLAVKPEKVCRDYASDDVCVINFRGGEYVGLADVFLNQKYWDDAIAHMRKINRNFHFVVVTDDVATAKKFFPDFEISHVSIGNDYSIINTAHYLILSNSSFAWFPAWLNEDLKYCIAPKYWARHNVSDGYWSCGYNITTGWEYLDRQGKLSTYEEAKKELDVYVKLNAELFSQKKIAKNFLVVSSYNNDLSWIADYTDRYLVYDKSEQGIYPKNLDKKKVIASPNVGYNIYDYCRYIVDHYDNLPDCVIFIKGNTFPRHVSKQYFDRIMNNEYFTPIEESSRHEEQWPVSFNLSDGGFCEVNNSWYLGLDGYHPVKYFTNFNNFLKYCFKDPVIPRYVRFAPGANYIVPKANILKLPKQFYENLQTFVSHHQLAGEAHICERALHTLWTSNFELSEAMTRPLDKHFTLAPNPTVPHVFGDSVIGLLERLTQRFFYLLRLVAAKISRMTQQ